MSKRRKKDNVVRNVLITVLGLVIAAFLIAYFSAEQPYIRAENICEKRINLDDWSRFNFEIKNYKDTDAYINPCLYSDFFMFKDAEGKTCNGKGRLLPYEEEGDRWRAYGIFDVRSNLNKLDSTNSSSITVIVSCSQKIWFVEKSCDSIYKLCEYKKEDDYWELID